ncbi:MAG: vitamin K epoxide reductase family protein [Roseiflexaceae bacterium]|nr:vitamin K epoxide reductase family protein [Roseiflexaceae bacterium]
MRRFVFILVLACALALNLSSIVAASTVRALLFYSPRCSHCHVVITEHLPLVQQRFGDQLQILMINVDQPQGAALYREAIAAYAIPEARRGVPTMIIGDSVLVGSVEIPQRLPGLVETLLDRGGSDWPPLPGLAAFLPAEPTALPAAPSPSVMPAETPPFLRDMPANALAVAVLEGMVLSVIWAAVAWSRPAHPPAPWRDRTIPLLALAGMGVAAYLTFIETTGAQAVCGPMGDCNTVQQSEFARIFGVLPVGVAGIAGYGAILMAWILAHRLRGAPGERTALALPALALIRCALLDLSDLPRTVCDRRHVSLAPDIGGDHHRAVVAQHAVPLALLITQAYLHNMPSYVCICPTSRGVL